MTWSAVHRRFWPMELVALGVALLGGAAVLVFATTMTAYTTSESEQTSTGAVIDHGSRSETLVAVNGPGVLVLAALPLVAALIVGGLLWRRGKDRDPGPLAWTLVGLLGLIMLAGMLTIGPVMMPTVAGLAGACAVRQGRRTVPGMSVR